MKLLAIGWIVVTPYGFAAAAAASSRVGVFMGRHFIPMVAAGWAGVALLLLGAFALHGPARAAALVLGAPLAGLSFWSRSDGGGGGGDDDDGDKPEDGPEDEVDWDRFMSDLDRWASRRQPVGRP